MILFAPILFAIGFILNLYLGNITELSLSELVIPIVFGTLVSLLLNLIFSLIFKSRVRGSVMAAVFVVAFFVLATLPIIGVLVIVGAFVWIFRSKRNFNTLAKYLLVTAIIVVIIAGVRILGEEKQKTESQVKSPLKLPEVKSTNTATLPDIYYIVPDSYSASKSLLKYYGFDNSQFENSLTKKGFYIATDSASNYPKTFVSLGSSLNMEYLDFMSVNKNSKNLSLLDPLIEDNNVVKFLTARGYKYYHLGSWWGATHTNRNATVNIILENENKVQLSLFDYIVLQSTILEPVIDKFLPKITVGDSDKDRMNRANYQFEKLGEIASEQGPKFVFAHIIAPHEPYFYDKNCNFVPAEERKKREEVPKYLDHLTCVNKKLEGSVSEILKNSKRPPVIIIQSDEGAPFLAEELTPPDSWGMAPLSLLKEKFPVFNAYYFPKGNTEGLYQTITPVNSFRLVFNKYLGTEFPLLPDKSYILPDLKHLYDFIDVTDKIRD